MTVIEKWAERRGPHIDVFVAVRCDCRLEHGDSYTVVRELLVATIPTRCTCGRMDVVRVDVEEAIEAGSQRVRPSIDGGRQ